MQHLPAGVKSVMKMVTRLKLLQIQFKFKVISISVIP